MCRILKVFFSLLLSEVLLTGVSAKNIDKNESEIKTFMNILREETCGILELHPTLGSSFLNLVKQCALGKIKPIVLNGENNLNKALIVEDSDENINIYPFVSEHLMTNRSLLQHMALCAVRVSVKTTDVMTRTPEKLLCILKKFPAIEKDVDEAVACLKNDVCAQKELNQLEKQGSENLEFQTAKVLLYYSLMQDIVDKRLRALNEVLGKTSDLYQKAIFALRDIINHTFNTSWNKIYDYYQIDPQNIKFNQSEKQLEVLPVSLIGNGTKWYMKLLDSLVQFDWRNETCEILESAPKSLNSALNPVKSCFLEKIKHNVKIALKVIHEAGHSIDVLRETIKKVKGCPLTDIAKLSKCILDINPEGVVANLKQMSNKNVLNYSNKLNEFEQILMTMQKFLFENTAVCTIQTIVSPTKLITETPEKLTCLMKKFPSLKRGVDEAIACLKDDACHQKELNQVKTRGSESLEFEIGRVILVGSDQECNPDLSNAEVSFEKGAKLMNDVRTKYLGALDNFMTDATNKTNSLFDTILKEDYCGFRTLIKNLKNFNIGLLQKCILGVVTEPLKDFEDSLNGALNLTRMIQDSKKPKCTSLNYGDSNIRHVLVNEGNEKEVDHTAELGVGLDIAVSGVKVFEGIAGIEESVAECAAKEGISNIKFVSELLGTWRCATLKVQEEVVEYVAFVYKGTYNCLTDQKCRQVILKHFLKDWENFKMEISKVFG